MDVLAADEDAWGASVSAATHAWGQHPRADLRKLTVAAKRLKDAGGVWERGLREALEVYHWRRPLATAVICYVAAALICWPRFLGPAVCAAVACVLISTRPGRRARAAGALGTFGRADTSFDEWRRRGYSVAMSRGDAVAATWLFRGDESR